MKDFILETLVVFFKLLRLFLMVQIIYLIATIRMKITNLLPVRTNYKKTYRSRGNYANYGKSDKFASNKFGGACRKKNITILNALNSYCRK